MGRAIHAAILQSSILQLGRSTASTLPDGLRHGRDHRFLNCTRPLIAFEQPTLQACRRSEACCASPGCILSQALTPASASQICIA